MKNKNLYKRAKENIINGFFWSIGVTLGFAFVSVFAILIVRPFLQLPIIGDFLADVVYETQVSLSERTPQGYDVEGTVKSFTTD